VHPKSDPSAVFDRALIAIEMASATTRLALALPEPHGARVLLSLKSALAVLLQSMDPTQGSSSPSAERVVHRTNAVRKSSSKRIAATVKAGLSFK